MTPVSRAIPTTAGQVSSPAGPVRQARAATTVAAATMAVPAAGRDGRARRTQNQVQPACTRVSPSSGRLSTPSSSEVSAVEPPKPRLHRAVPVCRASPALRMAAALRLAAALDTAIVASTTTSQTRPTDSTPTRRDHRAQDARLVARCRARLKRSPLRPADGRARGRSQRSGWVCAPPGRRRPPGRSSWPRRCPRIRRRWRRRAPWCGPRVR